MTVDTLEHADPLSPILRSAEQLEAELSDPVSKSEAAKIMDVSLSTVYASCHRFLATRRNGDVQGMRDNVPCLRFGEATIRIPRGAFIAFWTGVGLSRETLAEVYGQVITQELFGDEGEAA